MFRLEGVVNSPLESETARVEVPLEALSRVAVHVVACPLLMLPGVQLRLTKLAGVAGGVSVKFVDCVPPFSDAVMVTVSFEGTPVTDAANWALLCPVSTVTEPGTVTLALPSERPTVVFEVAAEANDTVQVAVPAAVKLLGAQVKFESPAGAIKFTWAVRETPFKLAVTVAV
jgi:hypothetical protein